MQINPIAERGEKATVNTVPNNIYGAAEPLIPAVGTVTDIRTETADVKTFRVVGTDGKKMFEHIPGQCAMLSVPGVGEAMFSITSSPTNTEYQEFSIKRCGCLTDFLHGIEAGQQITVRGPYGNGFPVDSEFVGKELVFIAGGIGLAPLRSVINYVRDKNKEENGKKIYGKTDIIYGSRSKDDLVFCDEIMNGWRAEPDFSVYLTVDKQQDGWNGHVGFVPDYIRELAIVPDRNKAVILCGPPVMIKFTLAALTDMGFDKTQIYTTMELRMKCGIGKCGRCNIGSKYVCLDGPVFRLDKLGELPDEY